MHMFFGIFCSIVIFNVQSMQLPKSHVELLRQRITEQVKPSDGIHPNRLKQRPTSAQSTRSATPSSMQRR